MERAACPVPLRVDRQLFNTPSVKQLITGRVELRQPALMAEDVYQFLSEREDLLQIFLDSIYAADDCGHGPHDYTNIDEVPTCWIQTAGTGKMLPVMTGTMD